MAKQPGKASTKPPLVDDPAVREVFADDFVGLYGIGPNFHLTFGVRRAGQDDPAKLSRSVAARLVMPLDTLLEVYTSLQNAVNRLDASGVITLRKTDDGPAPGGNA